MMDYQGFWQGFVVLFGVLPLIVGAAGGAIWAWRRGQRGAGLVPGALLGGIALALCVAAGAVFFFRA